jgi:cell wall-associated NlpC family hydrolase
VSARLDPRLYAYRDDLADATLQGRVQAAHYVDGQPYHVTAAIAPLHPKPSSTGDLDTQALYGEAVQVYDVADGWAWCQLSGDGYVGYMPLECLAGGAPTAPTHHVTSVETFVYREPRAGSPRLLALPFGAKIPLTAEADNYFELASGGFVGKPHAEPLGTTSVDYTQTALQFLRTPYLWGGKSVRGVDCSGLVQLSLSRAGVICPRDTDMQEMSLPGELEVTDGILGQLRRGDIVYWPGHVGIMIDDSHVVHASGALMCTGVEAISDVAERSRKGGPVFSAVKRPLNHAAPLLKRIL